MFNMLKSTVELSLPRLTFIVSLLCKSKEANNKRASDQRVELRAKKRRKERKEMKISILTCLLNSVQHAILRDLQAAQAL